MTVQAGLCRTWSKTPKTGFLRTRLISDDFLLPVTPNEPRRVETDFRGFRPGLKQTGYDTNRAVQLLKTARGLKFRIKEVEGLYYVAKTKALTAQLLCGFVFAYAKAGFLNDFQLFQ